MFLTGGAPPTKIDRRAAADTMTLAQGSIPNTIILAQGPYVTVTMGFKPAILLMQGVDLIVNAVCLLIK